MNLPSKQECEGWDQTQMAHFMFKNKMPECAATISRFNITGRRFLNLSETDLIKFSPVYQPQLQKMVQDIRKNDGSLLDKLRRLKNKPLPNLPAKDYKDEFRDGNQMHDPDYDNGSYVDLPDDDNYEPPPSHRALIPPPATLPRGEYIDNLQNPPSRPPRTPIRPSKLSQQLPPEPIIHSVDEDTYIDPDASNEEDNYVKPERSQTCDFFEPFDKQEKSFSLPTSRLCPPVQTKLSFSLPPKPSTRSNTKRFSADDERPTHDYEEENYEVCDINKGFRDQHAGDLPPAPPKPPPKERVPQSPLQSRPEFKSREFESSKPSKPEKQLSSLSFKRPKAPLPQFNSLKPPERGSPPVDNGSVDQDKTCQDADVCNKAWYASACDRRTADEALMRFNKDGAFMVRKSSGHDAQQPYTLVVFYKGRVYNIPIRFMPNTQQFALGREKRGEEFFSSVSSIIENHQKNPLVLIDAQSNSKDTTKLCFPVKP
ncbi:B-cell linker protein isoform X4 [Oryzias latipes]|uniref:B-cell linker protein isoform X4 n=1 Tax=Oryzias latipes TaxID=8090 RepID=UPI0009D91F62|nr:B-cell linker protein isoform X4 [Oryzias latipes]